MKTKCFAKINIALNILDKRKDGYHNIESIMQNISLCDFLFIKKNEKITVNSTNKKLPTDETNLAHKAAKMFFEKIDKKTGASIFIKKQIPVGAGLGGGSSNAAKVLLSLNKMFSNPLEMRKLLGIASKIGSDVSYFLLDSPALVTEVGSGLKQLPNFLSFFVLIIKPPFSISTKWCFENIDLKKIKKKESSNIPIILENIEKIKDLKNQKIKDELKNEMIDKCMLGIFKNSKNVFENFVFKHYPLLKKYKKFLIKNGAVFSLMSGTGSCIYGLFDNLDLCKKSCLKLKKMSLEAIICKTI